MVTDAAPGPAQFNRLIDLYNTGRHGAMEAGARELVERYPSSGMGWKILGVALQVQGKDALQAMVRAAELLPADAEAQFNLGKVLKDRGRVEDAVASYRQAVAANPAYAAAWNNLGNALQELGRAEEAIASLRQAIALRPDDAVAHNNLGNALKATAQWEAALDSFRRALAIHPSYVEALCNLGNLFAQAGQPGEAIRWLEQATAVRPDFAAAHAMLSGALRDLGRLVEARGRARRALELNPGLDDARRAFSLAQAYLSDYREVVGESDAALALNPDSKLVWENRLYSFSYHPELSAEEIFSEFVRWGNRCPDPGSNFSGHDRSSDRRLRVGYVSPDYRSHTSRFYFWPLFANHDRDAIELYAYSNVQREDGHTAEFKALFEHWRDISRLDDRHAAELVRRDGIDILVDCCNHMRDDRLGLFALKPAPVQVTWLGAAWTTGLKAVDYVLFDPFLAPEGTLARETIIRLPHCFVAYRPPQETAELVAPPCLHNPGITYIYSGRTERLNHRSFRVWGEILQAQPDSRLILDYAAFADPPTQAYYRQLLAGHGIAPERLTLRRSANIFAGLNDADIMLDCFPHSGGTMLFDALWMGLPALTLAGRPPLGRIGTSLMSNLGLTEWVAQSESDYVARALALSADRAALAELRAGMRDRMRNSPVMDGPGFARGVEAAYRTMFEGWSRG